MGKTIGEIKDKLVEFKGAAKNGELTIRGLIESIQGTTISAKAGSLALKGLALAGNLLATWAISEGIQLFIGWIDNLAHASEKAREASTELTDAWKSEHNSIDDSISKYKELQAKLTDSSLSIKEVTKVKEDLASLQDTLVKKYGQEALGIDFVNGKYDEQIAKLNDLSQKKAKAYLAENYSNIAEDRKYVNENYSVAKELYFSGYADEPDNYKNAGFEVKDFIEKYDKLSLRVTRSNSPNSTYGKFNLVTNGTREEAIEQLNALFNDLANEFGESNSHVNDFKQVISNILQESYDTQALETAKNNISQYVETEILEDDTARAVYQNAVDTVRAYNEALASGEGIDKAKENLDTIRDEVAAITPTIEGSEQVFQKIFDSIIEASASIPKDPFEPVTKSKAIEKVNSLSEGFESLNKIMSSIKDKENPFDYALLDDNKFKENFQGCEDAYTDFIETISNSPKDVDACQEAFNNLVTRFLDQKKITEILNDDTKELVASMLESRGVTNADAVVTDALIQAKSSSAAATIDATNITADQVQALADEAGATDEARQAFYAYTMQKLLDKVINTGGDIDALANVAKSLGLATSAWSRYYAAKRDMAKMEANKETTASGETYYSYTEKENGRVVNHIVSELAYEQRRRDLENTGNQFIQEIEDIAKKPTAKYGDGTKTNKSGSDKSPKEKEPPKKEYNWIQRANEKLEKQHKELQNVLKGETASYSTQIAAIDHLIEKDRQRKEFARMSAEAYEAEWTNVIQKIKEEAEKQGFDGDLIIDKIINGSISQNDIAETYQGDLVGFIDDGISAYDKSTEYASKQKDLEEEIEEHLKNQYEIRLAITRAQSDAVKSSIDILQAEMDLIEAQGGVVTERQLRDMIGLYDEQQQAYEDQIGTLRSQRDEVEDDSEEYYSLTASINDCEKSILQCQIQQAKLNEEIMNIPIRKIERYLELLKNIKQDLNNFMDEQSALGINPGMEEYQQLIDISQKQIDKLLEQQEELKNKLSNYSYGSDKFNEVQMEIQDIDDEISSLIQSQYEWNQSIVQIPVNKIKEVTDGLNSVMDALDDITSEYDTVISAVTTSIDKEIDKINEKKEAAEEAYQSEINAVQEKINALQQEKEETDLVLKEEKARAAFEKAQSQKTNKVLKNGSWEYEADLDTVRDSKKDLDDVLLEKQIDGLEKQIEVLEEERDALFETFDGQIEKLQEIQDKWSQITEDIKLAQEASKANEILGTGWLDKVLSGKDSDIFNGFKDQYETIEAQKELYNKQIETNNRLAGFMEKYIAAWQNGTLTYDEVVSSFDRLMKEMKDGFSSMDNLDAILGLVGDGDLSSSLDGMKGEITSSFDRFKEYTEAAQKNFEVLSKYTVTWETMKDAILKQLELLERLAAEEAKKPNRRPSSGGGGGGGGSHSSSGSGGKYEGPGYIDAVEKGDKDAVDSWNSGNHGGASNSTIDRIDKELGKKHNGIVSGLIGNNNSTREKMLKELSTTDLKPNEVLIKALDGEAIFTEEQQLKLLENLEPASHLPYLNLLPPSRNLQFFNKSEPSIPSISIGDIVLQGVQDPDGFAKALKRQIRPVMLQATNKRF